jgi:MoxR-like ATPase
MGQDMRFTGSSTYVATQDLRVAVNAALTLERPLLVKGEPGTGKTVLAEEVAAALKTPLLTWHIKSTTKAQQGLYEYDAVSRLRDSQLGDPRVTEIGHYIKRGKLWDAFTADERLVLLIDEIDKADIEFPNDLLLELDRMEFHVYETGETIRATKRPLVIITSNNEKELPDAFLRRCFFHYIKFPDKPTMEAIVATHFPDLKKNLIEEALRLFFQMREVPGLKKKPSTSELLDWLKLLLNEDITPEQLRESDASKLIPPLHGALLKNEQDVHMFERLAFLHRRERRKFLLPQGGSNRYDAARCSSNSAMAASAPSAAAPSGPPACAMSGRPPPPLPPSFSAARRTKSTALNFDVRSGVTATTTPARPSSETPTMATTPEPTLCLASSASDFRSFISTPETAREK